jgi:glucose-1-phosphate adenylyltransferase
MHSGLRQVLVLTQYKSHSLQKHLRDGWSIYNPELGEYITPVPPQMRGGADWYAGTADALYQNLYLLERNRAPRVLVLSGDHVYRMDYAELLSAHAETSAVATMACLETGPEPPPHLGVVAMDDDGRVTGLMQRLADADPHVDVPGQALVSMGIFAFEKERLLAELRRDAADPGSSHDLERNILPQLVTSGTVHSYRFGGARGRVTQDRFWRDLSTLDDYYDANMALLEHDAPLDLYQEDWTIHTYQGQYPPARTVPGESGTEGVFVNSILAAGTVIAGGGVNHSILFPQVKVGDGAIVEDSILFNGVQVGAGAYLRRCIVDKGVGIPAHAQIGLDPDTDAERFTLSEAGVVVIPKGYRF